MAAQTGAQSKNLMKRKSSKKEDKNPYADRGIDKFSALLAEVEEKKRMIYSQHNPDEVSMIRFVYGSDNKLKPVVVKSNNKAYNRKIVKVDLDRGSGNSPAEDEKQEKVEIEVEEEKTERSSSEEISSEFDSVQPWYYLLGGMVVLIVILIAMFGKDWKSFYLVQLQSTICPRIQGD